MYENPGESKVNIAVGGNHIEVQSSYAYSKHIALGFNKYLGQTNGFTATAEYFTPIFNRTYFSLQGGFGEQKMDLFLTDKVVFNYMYNEYATVGYYTNYLIQPGIYTAIDNGRIKTGLLYRFSQNNYSNFVHASRYVESLRTYNIYSTKYWEMVNPSKVNTHTFMFSYQKDSKNRKCFYQVQLGFVFSGKINVDYYTKTPDGKYSDKERINQYTIPFNPFVFNLTGGINLDYFYTQKRYY
jgi:hypothetical protein